MSIIKGELLFFMIIYVNYSLCVVWTPYNAAKELWRLYLMIDNINLNTTEDIKRVNELLNNEADGEIKNQIDRIHEKLEEIELTIDTKKIENSIKQLSSDFALDRASDTFELFIEEIDENYDKFRDYMNKSDFHSNDELQNLLQKSTLELEMKIAGIRTFMSNADAILPERRNLVFAVTGLASALNNELCDGPQIISSFLIQLFSTVIVAEIKGNLMLFIGNLHKYTANDGWKRINSFASQQFKTNYVKYIKLFELNLILADSLFLRACNPENGTWIRDKSFYEFEGTFQTTIFRHHWAKCKFDSCNSVWFDKAPQCDPQIYDLRSSCSATLAECAYLSAIDACVLKDGPYKFLYVNSSELGFLGRNLTCPKDAYKIEDGRGWDFNYAACACNCYSDHNKISLMIMESHVKSNRVIIGLRFIRRNNVLYIQPQEGILTNNGRIRRYSSRWINIPPNTGKKSTQAINKENKVFFLGDVRLAAKFVLTGIKFSEVTRQNIKGFAIEIFGVPFDYESGKLSEQRISSISMKALKSPLIELPFTAVSSAHTKQPHTISSSKMRYISLTRSTLRANFGQSTLPFFDATPVKTNYPSLLGGVGIFHKGVDGYAGIIALRIYGIKYGVYFEEFQAHGMKKDELSFIQSPRDSS